MGLEDTRAHGPKGLQGSRPLLNRHMLVLLGLPAWSRATVLQAAPENTGPTHLALLRIGRRGGVRPCSHKRRLQRLRSRLGVLVKHRPRDALPEVQRGTAAEGGADRKEGACKLLLEAHGLGAWLRGKGGAGGKRSNVGGQYQALT